MHVTNVKLSERKIVSKTCELDKVKVMAEIRILFKIIINHLAFLKLCKI
jgi:hypothetical protein